VIPNGVDIERFRVPSAAERLAARGSLGLDADSWVAVFIGHEFDRKGLPLALEAVARTPGVQLLVVGGTPQMLERARATAERVGADTLLGRIVQMVADAQRTRAPIQGLADKVAGIFVPFVLAVSILTFLAWIGFGPEPRLAHAIVNAVAVLIIACPCALGLATPMSIMVAVGRGAREGVLVKDAATLQELEKVTMLVVDKTGTPTEGCPQLVDIIPVDGMDAKELLQLAASLEQGSEHPLADAVLRGAKDIPLLPTTNFRAVAGGGVLGDVAGRKIVVGKAEFLRSEKITGLDHLAMPAARLQEDGKSVLFIGGDGAAYGLIAVFDPIKATTAAALSERIRSISESAGAFHPCQSVRRRTTLAILSFCSALNSR
jgi:Cu+-exporting ATPase